MSVAVYVKSESGDNYVYSFSSTETLLDIKTRLMNDIEMFQPLAEYEVSVSRNESEDMLSSVEDLMQYVFEQSWKRDYD